MSTLVHLTLEDNAKRMRRVGIKPQAIWIPSAGHIKAVFASPIVPNYFVTHQWLRELKRKGGRTIVGVQFKLSDHELVHVGHYGDRHKQMTASEAESLIRSMETPLGYEIIIPRKILPREIKAIRHLPQVIGWRYYPKAHGHKPCLCPVCIDKGGIKSRKLREKSDAREAEIMDSFDLLMTAEKEWEDRDPAIPDPNRPSDANRWKQYKRQKIQEWKMRNGG